MWSRVLSGKTRYSSRGSSTTASGPRSRNHQVSITSVPKSWVNIGDASSASRRYMQYTSVHRDRRRNDRSLRPGSSLASSGSCGCRAAPRRGEEPDARQAGRRPRVSSRGGGRTSRRTAGARRSSDASQAKYCPCDSSTARLKFHGAPRFLSADRTACCAQQMPRPARLESVEALSNTRISSGRSDCARTEFDRGLEVGRRRCAPGMAIETLALPSPRGPLTDSRSSSSDSCATAGTRRLRKASSTRAVIRVGTNVVVKASRPRRPISWSNSRSRSNRASVSFRASASTERDGHTVAGLAHALGSKRCPRPR